MSDAAYTPREGTIPAKVIEHLQAQPEGTVITTAEITELFGTSTGVTTNMHKAVEAGLVLAQKVGRNTGYSLPPAPPEPGGPLVITAWTDGDVVVTGAQVSDDGTIVFTRSQIEQLVRQVTQPHVRLMGVVHHPV